MGVNTALGSMTTFGPEIRRIAERLLTLYGQLSGTDPDKALQIEKNYP